MSKESLVMRMLCAQGNIDAQRFRNGFLSRLEWAQIAKSLGVLADTKIFLDDTPGLSVLEMRAKARRLAAEQKKLDLIIVDYLQLMSGSSKRTESRQQEVSQISRELERARERDERAARRVVTAFTRPESRSITDRNFQTCVSQAPWNRMRTWWPFIFREEQYKTAEEREAMPEDRKNIAELIIAKQRNGPTGTG
jgi:replicative DNA helicase